MKVTLYPGNNKPPIKTTLDPALIDPEDEAWFTEHGAVLQIEQLSLGEFAGYAYIPGTIPEEDEAIEVVFLGSPQAEPEKARAFLKSLRKQLEEKLK